jgi:hypothetical protein
VALFHLDGVVSRVAEGETAFGNRQVQGASHAITIDAMRPPGGDFGDQGIAWTRRFFAARGPSCLIAQRRGLTGAMTSQECDSGRKRETAHVHQGS